MFTGWKKVAEIHWLWWKKYKNRIPILHIKDMAPGATQDFECPGNGIIDFPSIFTEAVSEGIEHFMVERDNVPDGMACLQSSGEYWESEILILC